MDQNKVVVGNITPATGTGTGTGAAPGTGTAPGPDGQVPNPNPNPNQTQKRLSTVSGNSGNRKNSTNSNNNNNSKPEKKKPAITDSRIDLNYFWPKKIYAETLLEAYNIYQKTMHIFFRYPIFLRRDPDDGAFVFRYKQCSMFPIMFVLSSVLIALETAFVIFNTIGLLLNFPFKTSDNYTFIKTTAEEHSVLVFSKYEMRAQELYLFQRNLVPVIIIISCLIHSTVGNINFFKKRHIIAAYYTFWLKAVEMMQIDAAYDLVLFMRYFMFAFLGFIICLGMMEACKLAPITAGAPSIIALLTLRLSHDDIHLREQFWFYRLLFGLLILYIFINAKSSVMLFILTSKLLKNCILIWNHRANRVLNGGERYKEREEKHAERIGFDHLFKDFVCILDLMEGADVIFANSIESFFATHIISIVFELFYVYQSMTLSKEFQRGRELDFFPMALFVTQSMVFMYQASVSASDVAEQSLDGLEIIRRKGILGRRSDEELYFVLSLYVCYTGHFDIGINASKMFTFNKSFLISMFVLSFTFFIIVLQFTPVLMMTDRVKLDRITQQISLSQLNEVIEGFYGRAFLMDAATFAKDFDMGSSTNDVIKNLPFLGPPCNQPLIAIA